MGKQSQRDYIMAARAIRAAHIFSGYCVGLCKFKVVRSTGKSLVAKKAEVAKKKVSYGFLSFFTYPGYAAMLFQHSVLVTCQYNAINKANKAQVPSAQS